MACCTRRGHDHDLRRQVHEGSPALSRLGAFVEGPASCRTCPAGPTWRCTGARRRPATDSHLAEILDIAGLGAAIDRPVRAYSRGMRQRLAIAQPCSACRPAVLDER